MKYEDNNESEGQKLLRSNRTINTLHENYFMTRTFIMCLKAINITLLSYVLISTIFYFVVHYYGKRIINTKALRVEYDYLLNQNLIVNFFFTLSNILGFITITKRSIKLFCLFFLTLNFYSTLFVFSFLFKFQYNFFFQTKFMWVGISILIINSSIITYMIYYLVSIIYNNKNAIKNSKVPPSTIIHEINLRTDMFKISYNYLIIQTKLHKLIPSLLFKSDSYYFTTLIKKTNSDPLEKSNKRGTELEKKCINVEYISKNFDSNSTFYTS